MQPFEHLDVYRVAVEFGDVVWEAFEGRQGSDYDQLRRAHGSVENNIAEAAILPPGPNKARVFRIALGEAGECLAVINRLRRKGEMERLTYNRSRSLIERDIKMLRKLSTPRRDKG